MPEPLELRDYQLASIESLRDGIRAGHRSQMLYAPTGAGKTACGAYLLRETSAKYKRAAFVVDRVNLVDQTSAVLDRYGISHGIVQAGHWRRQPWERIQVCSAQTLEKRGFFPDLDLLVVDEAHCTRQQTAELIRNRPDLRVIGLSATPFTKGLGEIYSNVVGIATTNALVDRGYLVPLKMYAATAIDMSGAKIVAGEWAERDIEERGITIVGDIVSEWQAKTQQHFGGPVKTIVFSATVAHGAELCRQFNAAGYNFQQVSYKDGNEERRRELIAAFREGTVTGLVSCEVFTKGFDVPDVLCGIGARPYRKSLSSHIQQLGRVMRSSPGKDYALWLDHCGNVLRFHADTQTVFEAGVSSLDDGKLEAKARPDPTKHDKSELTCSCGYVLPPRCVRCPGCGREHSKRSLVETAAGAMFEVGTAAGAKIGIGLHALGHPDEVWPQLCAIADERSKGDPEAAKKRAAGYFRGIYGTWPRRAFEPAKSYSVAVKNRITANAIRYAKSPERRAP